MSTNSNEDALQKETEDDQSLQTNNTDIENTNNNTKETDNAKSASSGEIVVKIEESLQENLKKDINDRDFMVYGYHGQNHALPTTWVYFQQAGQTDYGSQPLEYTPDRNAFIRIVFIIVFIMLACTAMLNVLVFLSEGLSDLFKDYGLYLLIAGTVLMVSLNYAMACSSCARVMPCNIICLVLAVVGMSIICCCVTIKYDTKLILFAVAATGGVVIVCLLLACSSFDFTKWLLYVIVISAAFGMISIIVSLYMLISGNYIKIMHLVMLCVGTVISVIILTMELQMILGGKTIELSEDDYALGAFLLYTSIIDIFLKLVQIMGITDSW